MHVRGLKSRSFVVALALAAGLVTLTAAPALAMDGHVPDSRPATPQAEITAQYWHGLNRDPDSGGLANYMSFVNQNCRWGVLDGSYKILNSSEARNRWRNNPQTLAGMLYAALLNRPADPGGIATYTRAIHDRGLSWAIASMMASPEYRARLSRICSGRSGQTANMYTWTDAQDFAKTVLIQRAINLGRSCAFTSSTKLALGRLMNSPNLLIDSVGLIAQTASKMELLFGLDGTCGAAVQFLKATLAIGGVVNGSQYNPVFIQWSTGNPSGPSRQIPFTVRVGSNPTSWTGYSGKAW